MKDSSKSVSCRLKTEDVSALNARAAEQQLKPAVLMNQILSGWLHGSHVPKETTVQDEENSKATQLTLESLERSRQEAFLCRAVWTLIVALSPTLDEQSARSVVNELMQPASRDWGANSWAS